MSSQYGEHEYIEGFFRARVIEHGTFLDIGAYDGVTFSNTYQLYKRGWTGVLVEPSPRAFEGLKLAYPEDSGCLLVCAAIAPEEGLRPLQEAQCYPVSTFDGPTRHKAGPMMPFRSIYVATVTWADLLSLAPLENFDFINIDVEGMNLEILRAMPSRARLRPELMCVELDPDFAIRETLREMGYTVQTIIGGNVLASRGAE